MYLSRMKNVSFSFMKFFMEECKLQHWGPVAPSTGDDAPLTIIDKRQVLAQPCTVGATLVNSVIRKNLSNRLGNAIRNCT